LGQRGDVALTHKNVYCGKLPKFFFFGDGQIKLAYFENRKQGTCEPPYLINRTIKL
jgi:hypothetical protein